MSEQLYTASRLRVIRQCLRLHLYRYVMGIQTPQSDAAMFGTVGHSALEAWYRAWQRGELDARLPLALAAIEASTLSPYDKARLRAIVTAYHVRWGGEPWEVLGVEVEFRYRLGDHLIGGKIDAIIRDTRDGRTWIVEHKTTGRDASPGGDYWSVLSIDVQVSIYLDGSAMLGHEIAGCIYDVLQRPRHDVKLATPESERKYTLGMGCKLCSGGKGKKGAGTLNGHVCHACDGRGWRKDEHGVPEAPHLYANQREVDETLVEFAERIIESITAEPDAYLIRGVVVRLDDELPRMRQDLLDAIEVEQMATAKDLAPRNPDACARYGSMCHFFAACAHQASIDDEAMFPRGRAHPELAA